MQATYFIEYLVDCCQSTSRYAIKDDCATENKRQSCFAI